MTLAPPPPARPRQKASPRKRAYKPAPAVSVPVPAVATVHVPPVPSSPHLFPGVPASLLRPFTVDEYLKMVEVGILQEDNRYELLEGMVVGKMPEGPIHSGMIEADAEVLRPLLAGRWHIRIAHPVVTAHDAPEPDLAVVRGRPRDYLARHPGRGDIGLVIEVAHSSLDRDRQAKRIIYARAGIGPYWIINLEAVRLEVYADPTGDVPSPTYRSLVTLAPGQTVPLVLDGVTVADLAVADLLP